MSVLVRLNTGGRVSACTSVIHGCRERSSRTSLVRVRLWVGDSVRGVLLNILLAGYVVAGVVKMGLARGKRTEVGRGRKRWRARGVRAKIVGGHRARSYTTARQLVA